MNEIKYRIREGRIMGQSGTALVREDEDVVEELLRTVINSISTELMVTVGDVTMHYAAWEDPEHWSWDWEQEHGKDFDPHQHLMEHVAKYVPAGERT